MSKAHVDPAELRKFAHDLTRFSNDVQSLLASLNGKLRTLEQTWRDQEQRKFTEAFNATAKSVGHFLEAAHEHASLLNKKAGVIEEYLKQR